MRRSAIALSLSLLPILALGCNADAPTSASSKEADSATEGLDAPAPQASASAAAPAEPEAATADRRRPAAARPRQEARDDDWGGGDTEAPQPRPASPGDGQLKRPGKGSGAVPVPRGLSGGGKTRPKRKPAPPSWAYKPEPVPSKDEAPTETDVPPAPVLDDAGRPTAMFFEHYGVNPTIDTAEAPKSTFAVDVDTASYTLTRAFLGRGQLPAEGAVRVEEIVNAFDYDYAGPTSDDEAFSVHAEAAPSPTRDGYHLLHVGIQGKQIQKAQRKTAHLTFVVDVSGSMNQDNRLGLVKQSLRLMVEQLGEADTVALVTYGTDAKQILPPTSAHHRSRILSAIDRLHTEGATNAEAGLRMGYQIAGANFTAGHVNRVILCSDGVANVGITGPGGLLSNIVKEAKRGITLTTVGVGMGNYNDVLLEQLADKGEGNYFYVDRLAQARKVFVEQLTGTLEVIAKDVKIQVAFDPTVVQRYRLIGYENRALKTQDFDDDRVDAGEIGAGHSVTALYEVKLAPARTAAPLGAVRVRYKAPEGGASRLVEKDLRRAVVRGADAELSSPTQLSLIAAQFAEKLRGSYWARTVRYDDILARFDRLSPELQRRDEVQELKRLITKADELDQRVDKFATHHGPIARMDFDQVPVLR